MNIASIGKTVIVAQMSGDRPAIITRVLTNKVVEACGFFPDPVALKTVSLHDVRAEAINAGLQRDGAEFHAYWPGK